MEDQQSILPQTFTDALARIYSQKIKGEVKIIKYLMSDVELEALKKDAAAAELDVDSLLAQRVIQSPITDWGGGSEGGPFSL